uniref:RNA-binding protein 8A n=1 Tax=Acrobeloides nanus TaxID=290746 RepID=A0A914E8W6_9BILA
MASDTIAMDEEMDYASGEDDLEEARNRASKKKGRGFKSTARSNTSKYESLDDDGTTGPQRSVEGWIIFVTNINEEAAEEDLKEKFKEYGNLINMHVNLDRRTGFFKGYAVVQFETKAEAADAIRNLNGSEFLGQTLSADWAFVKGKSKRK